MKTEQAFDLMEKLLPHVAAVMNDAETHATVEDLRADKNIKGGDAMARLLPLMLGKHRQEMYEIAAIVMGKTAEEVVSMPIDKTLKALNEGFTDHMLLLFGACMRIVRI